MKHQVYSCGLAAIMTFSSASAGAVDRIKTATPIKHLAVIFQENVSFDHYFGSYRVASNGSGEAPSAASETTPRSINNLLTPFDVNNNFTPLEGVDLMDKNPNGPSGSGAAINGSDAPLAPAQSRAQRDDQHLVEIVRRGVPRARIIHSIPAGDKLLLYDLPESESFATR